MITVDGLTVEFGGTTPLSKVIDKGEGFKIVLPLKVTEYVVVAPGIPCSYQCQYQ